MKVTKMDDVNEDLRNEKEVNDRLRSTLVNAKKEVIEMDEKLYTLTERVLSFNKEVKTKEKTIHDLASELEQSNKRIEFLENNLGIKNVNNQSPQQSSSSDEEQTHTSPDESWPRVVILHDSICDDINESIMIREKVMTKKIRTHSLVQMQTKLQEIGAADVIVLQALTNSMLEEASDNLYRLINETTCVALSKAKKVVINTIIVRSDDHVLKGKAELVNAMLMYFYVNEPRVVICNNDNLQDSKFQRKGEINLTPHGTSLLAVNLKHKIAEALNIQVVKKPARSYRQRNPSK